MVLYGPPHYYYFAPLIIGVVYTISVSYSYNHHTQMVAPRSRKKRRQTNFFFGSFNILSYYKKAGVCLSFCLSVTEKFVDLSPSAETGLRRA